MNKINFLCRMFLMAIAVLALLQSSGSGLSVSEDQEQPSSFFGISGGYFTCKAPSGWQQRDQDAPDYMISEMLFMGPEAERMPVIIGIHYYAAGNPTFQDDKDFVQRTLAEAREVEVGRTKILGRDAVVFEREYQDLFTLALNEDNPLWCKDKYYVFSGKDSGGFFVLRYAAPRSAYAEYLPVFEAVKDSFKFV